MDVSSSSFAAPKGSPSSCRSVMAIEDDRRGSRDPSPQEAAMSSPGYTPEEQRLVDAWERHIHLEFAARDAPATVDTMADDNYVNHVPVMTGGRGRDEMLEFYGRRFIPHMPTDTALTPVCRTVSVAQQRIVDEMIFRFTHDIPMDWMLPGVAPTRR